MRKVFVAILCLVLLLSMSAVTFAAEEQDVVVGDNAFLIPYIPSSYGYYDVFFCPEASGVYTFSCSDPNGALKVYGRFGDFGNPWIGTQSFCETASYEYTFEAGDVILITLYCTQYEDTTIHFNVEATDVVGGDDINKPEYALSLGENNVSVSAGDALDGMSTAFTAEQSGYYRLESTDDNAFIVCGDVQLEGAGGSTVFKLMKDMYKEVLIGTYSLDADDISFTITYLGDVDTELEVGDNGVFVTEERAVHGMECTFTAPVEGVYLFTLNDENGRVFVHGQWLVNGQTSEFVLVAGQTIDVDVATENEQCDNILLNITLKDDVVEHNYIAEVTAPTCLSKGYTTYTCSDCGHSYQEDYVDALGHKGGEPVRENDIPASCATAGSYQMVTYCQNCNDPIKRETFEVPATGEHVYATEVERKEATCEEDGYIVNVCTCGDRQTTTLNKLGHDAAAAVKENEKANSCTVDGSFDMVVYCNTCHQELSRETTTVPASGHQPAAPVKENEQAPTCAVDGSYDQVTYCQVCNEVVERKHVTISATGEHVYANEVERKDATCTEDGYVILACGCGARKTNTITKLGHEAAAAVKENEIAATCTADGSYDMAVYCKTCKEELSRETKVVKATGHDNEKAVKENEVAATCTTDGSYDMVVYCKTCKAEVSRETTTVKATGHSPAAAVQENVMNATCSSDGSYDLVVYCITCKAEISRENKTVVATGDHVYATQTERKEPTCTEDGYVVMACGCGATEKTTLTATGHIAGDAVKENEVAPTCTSDGAYDMVTYCSACNAEMDRVTTVVTALGHTGAEAVRENEVAATCTTDGSYDQVVYCSVCKAEMNRESFVIAATGEHVYATETERKEATCTEAGFVVMACGCGKTQTTELPIVDHVAAEAVKENEVAATCTAVGSYDMVVKCVACGAELSRETATVAMTEHTYGDWETTKEPTATENGTKTHTCTACGAQETEEIPATGEQPTNPQPTEPLPTEPQPTEPKPTETEPAVPATKPATQPTQSGDQIGSEGGNTGVIIAVILAVIVVGGVVVFLVMKKKK